MEKYLNHHRTLRTRIIHWMVLQLDRLALFISHEGPISNSLWSLIPERDRL